MDLGIGFAIGALAGFMLVIIVNLILAVSRKVIRKGQGKDGQAVPAAPAVPAPPKPGGKTAAQSERMTQTNGRDAPTARSARSVVVTELEANEGQLNKAIQEVRDMVHRLAKVVSRTDDASGKATAAFNSIRNTVDKINLDESDSLLDAQRELVAEIDRVLKTNAVLQTELDAANKGIAAQRRQIEELRVAARVDGLTRIPNRAAFDERMREYASLAGRDKIVFTLLLLDIDHFKRINDEHGHQSGDRILRGVATKISENIRANDFAARYGGEEFAVIFPATSIDEAAVVADRMRQDIADTKFRLDNKTIHVTLSGGLYECRNSLEIDTVVSKADQELYKAKNNGRNIISGGQTPSPGN